MRLFNDQGTAAVSTNHVAAAAGVSPGNLYYHFRNKEDIIRELFERMFATWDTVYRLPSNRRPILSDLDALITANYRQIWRHRFAYREMAALLRGDPRLRARYQVMRRRGHAGFKSLIKAFVASGVLTLPSTAGELNVLTELCWVISEQWPVNLELSGRAFTANGIRQGIALMRMVLKPYLAGVEEEML